VVYCAPVLSVVAFMSCLLVVDASSALCSVAVGLQENHWHISEHQPRGHAQRLLPMVSEVLVQAGIQRQQLQGIAYGRGPGSFTGIRIAASVMQGIALALDIPVAGISSLQAVAQQVLDSSSADRVMAVMDAHMGEVFWGLYERDGEYSRLIGQEHVGSPDLFLQTVADMDCPLAGNGLALESLADLDGQYKEVQPLALTMLKLAEPVWQGGGFGAVDEHQPVYLRDTVAWKKLDEQPSLLNRS